MFFPFLWIFLGLLLDALSRSFGLGLPNPFTFDKLTGWLVEWVNVVGLLINVFILYAVGLGIDRGVVDRWRSPEPAECRQAILWSLVSVMAGVSIPACGGVQPLLTPAEQTVLGLEDLHSRPYGAWASRASATAAFDVHFSNYEVVHPRGNPGPCEGPRS